MTVRYHLHQGHLDPDYVCQREKIERGAPLCQSLPGKGVDAAITRLLLDTLTPISLEVALSVQQEITTRQEEADALRAQQVTRAQYEADLAGQRYRRVDPNHRLVASTLEAEWNAALHALQKAQEDYDHHRQADRQLIDEQLRSQIMALTTDFPRVWNDPHTTDRDRKRLVRLMLEDVTLIKTHEVTLHVRFRGGATQTLTFPSARPPWQTYVTPPDVLQMIDSLLDQSTDDQVATILNQRGLHPGKGGAFQSRIIAHLRRDYGLKNHYDRLREAGMLTVGEMAERLAVSESTIKKWRREGLLQGLPGNEKGVYLFEPPGANAPTKSQGRKLSTRRQFPETEMLLISTKEVQYES
jgi:stress-induced morphogen